VAPLNKGLQSTANWPMTSRSTGRSSSSGSQRRSSRHDAGLPTIMGWRALLSVSDPFPIDNASTEFDKFNQEIFSCRRDKTAIRRGQWDSRPISRRVIFVST
jgi:hypothetical protein